MAAADAALAKEGGGPGGWRRFAYRLVVSSPSRPLSCILCILYLRNQADVIHGKGHEERQRKYI
jgi:hypothetical protein